MRTCRGTPGGAASGFTLVEVLIALTLFGLIMAILSAGLYAASRGWRAGSAQIEVTDTQRLVQQFLRRQIEEAAPIMVSGADEPRLAFDGRPDTLRFVSPLPSQPGESGLHWLTIEVRRGPGSDPELILRHAPLHPDLDFFDDSPDEKGSTLVLAASVVKASFDYFGRIDADEVPTWHRDWRGQSRLPDRIRARFETVTPGSAWPEVVAPLRTQYQDSQPQMVLYAAAP